MKQTNAEVSLSLACSLGLQANTVLYEETTSKSKNAEPQLEAILLKAVHSYQDCENTIT